MLWPFVIQSNILPDYIIAMKINDHKKTDFAYGMAAECMCPISVSDVH
jgi:hypothetical protein